jgi:NAD(P)-dependent dehydrogenase (short-subunit alcohol dehydrogenase family)
MKMKGKVVLVTGAAGGIGRATACAFAIEGATVVVSDVDTAGAERTVALIREADGDATFERCDVACERDVRDLIAGIQVRHGRLDYAVNNAGIEGRKDRVADYSLDEYETIMNVNVRGVLQCLKYELQLMVEQGGGAIVNVASIAGIGAAPKMAAYSASKHAVIGLTRTAAVEYGRKNIRVNAVCPGMIATEMLGRIIENGAVNGDVAIAAHPMGRVGTPEEIASAILFLCSDGAGYLNGHALVVDGGGSAI